MTILKDRRAIALLLAATLTIMANATISPALPQIQALFPDDANAALLTRLLVTAPALMVAFFAPLAGMASDRFGRRKLLLSGVFLYGIAGTAGLYLPTLQAILISRLGLGLAVALIMTSQQALIGDYFSEQQRSHFMGYQISANNFGGFLFMTTAGLVAELSARLPFAVYGIALLYFPFLFFAIRDVEIQKTDTDPAIPHESTDPWIGRLAFLCLLSCTTVALFYVMPTQFSFFLQSIGHHSPMISGLLLGTMTLAGGFIGFHFGRVREHFGKGGAPAIGYSLMCYGYLVIGFTEHLPVIALGTAMIGGGFGLVMPTFIVVAIGLVPRWRRGLAAGSITTSIYIGQFLSPLAMQPIINTWQYHEAFFIVAACLAGFACLFLGIFRRNKTLLSASTDTEEHGQDPT